jgi:hypothetical protein
LCRGFILEEGGGGKRSIGGILGLLCRQHFPGMVQYAGNLEPATSFNHYAMAPDALPYGNKADRVLAAFWVSLPRSIHCIYLIFLEIMNT